MQDTSRAVGGVPVSGRWTWGPTHEERLNVGESAKEHCSGIDRRRYSAFTDTHALLTHQERPS